MFYAETLEVGFTIFAVEYVYRIYTRKPSCRWQTHATRKHAKIALIRRAYNVVADNTGLSSFV